MNPFENYYMNQAGSGVGQVYIGASPYLRGKGIGSFFSGLFRSVFPLVKSGARAFGQEALKSGVGFLHDTMSKTPLKQSIKNRLRQAGENLLTRANKRIDAMTGSGKRRRRRVSRGARKVAHQGIRKKACKSRKGALCGGRQRVRRHVAPKTRLGYIRKRKSRSTSQRHVKRRRTDIFKDGLYS